MMLQIVDYQLRLGWPLWFLLFAFLARILGPDWLADGVVSVVNLVRVLFSLFRLILEGYWNGAGAYYEGCETVVDVVVGFLFPPTLPDGSIAQHPDITSPSGNEDKKGERKWPGPERRQKELVETWILLQPRGVRSRTPLEETPQVMPNSQNKCRPKVQLPTYLQVEAGGPSAVNRDMDEASVAADKDRSPVVNFGQRNSDSLEGNSDVGENDEENQENKDGDLGVADREYQDEGRGEAAENKAQNLMVMDEVLVTTSTSPMPKSLQSGNRISILVHSYPRWRPPGKC
ncbi:MAG: hypothetical protein L6R42_002125 [Xanthoria sp. 1 TBL-2021]|nr:MAG: hypothetical protein L6R42_002125 [Xanthoria sp. 1 TBL-2021]